MPQLFRIGSYIIYFWSNESDPLEPIHVHVAEGRASANATKIWINRKKEQIDYEFQVRELSEIFKFI